MTDDELVLLLHKNDEQALEALMTRYTIVLYSVAGSILKTIGTMEDIEECVSNVFVELWRKPNNWHPHRGSLQTYLVLLGKREALNRAKRIRKSYTIPLEESIASYNDVVQEVLFEETKTALNKAINDLHEPDREIFIRRHLLGHKPKEIALSMELPVREITNRLYRCRSKIKKEISSSKYSVIIHERG